MNVLLSLLTNPKSLRILMLVVVFMCGVGANSYYVEHKRLIASEKALEKGQQSVLEYIRGITEEGDKSNEIITESLKSGDAPVAPVITDYFNRLPK